MICVECGKRAQITTTEQVSAQFRRRYYTCRCGAHMTTHEVVATVNGWTPWHGMPPGKPPVTARTKVTVRLQDGDIVTGKAGNFLWSCYAADPIVEYKVGGK